MKKFENKEFNKKEEKEILKASQEANNSKNVSRILKDKEAIEYLENL